MKKVPPKKTYGRKDEKSAINEQQLVIIQDEPFIQKDSFTNQQPLVTTIGSASSSQTQFSLPSGQWKDSFDKLMERTLLRQQNLIKKTINASLNRDSVYINSKYENSKILHISSANSTTKMPLQLTRNKNYTISTPLGNKNNDINVDDELICPLSPIKKISFENNRKTLPSTINTRQNSLNNSLIKSNQCLSSSLSTLPSITIEFCSSSISQQQTNSSKENHKSTKNEQQQNTKKLKKKLQKIKPNQEELIENNESPKPKLIVKFKRFDEKIDKPKQNETELDKKNKVQNKNNKTKINNEDLKDLRVVINKLSQEHTTKTVNVNNNICLEENNISSTSTNLRSNKNLEQKKLNKNKSPKKNLNQKELTDNDDNEEEKKDERKLRSRVAKSTTKLHKKNNVQNKNNKATIDKNCISNVSQSNKDQELDLRRKYPIITRQIIKDSKQIQLNPLKKKLFDNEDNDNDLNKIKRSKINNENLKDLRVVINKLPLENTTKTDNTNNYSCLEENNISKILTNLQSTKDLEHLPSQFQTPMKLTTSSSTSIRKSPRLNVIKKKPIIKLKRLQKTDILPYKEHNKAKILNKNNKNSFLNNSGIKLLNQSITSSTSSAVYSLNYSSQHSITEYDSSKNRTRTTKMKHKLQSLEVTQNKQNEFNIHAKEFNTNLLKIYDLEDSAVKKPKLREIVIEQNNISMQLKAKGTNKICKKNLKNSKSSTNKSSFKMFIKNSTISSGNSSDSNSRSTSHSSSSSTSSTEKRILRSSSQSSIGQRILRSSSRLLFENNLANSIRLIQSRNSVVEKRILRTNSTNNCSLEKSKKLPELKAIQQNSSKSTNNCKSNVNKKKVNASQQAKSLKTANKKQDSNRRKKLSKSHSSKVALNNSAKSINVSKSNVSQKTANSLLKKSLRTYNKKQLLSKKELSQSKISHNSKIKNTKKSSKKTSNLTQSQAKINNKYKNEVTVTDIPPKRKYRKRKISSTSSSVQNDNCAVFNGCVHSFLNHIVEVSKDKTSNMNLSLHHDTTLSVNKCINNSSSSRRKSYTRPVLVDISNIEDAVKNLNESKKSICCNNEISKLYSSFSENSIMPKRNSLYRYNGNLIRTSNVSALPEVDNIVQKIFENLDNSFEVSSVTPTNINNCNDINIDEDQSRSESSIIVCQNLDPMEGTSKGFRESNYTHNNTLNQMGQIQFFHDDDDDVQSDTISEYFDAVGDSSRRFRLRGFSFSKNIPDQIQKTQSSVINQDENDDKIPEYSNAMKSSSVEFSGFNCLSGISDESKKSDFIGDTSKRISSLNSTLGDLPKDQFLGVTNHDENDELRHIVLRKSRQAENCKKSQNFEEKSTESINAYEISQNLDIVKVPSKPFNSANCTSHQRSENQNCGTINLRNQNEIDDKLRRVTLRRSRRTQNSKKSQNLDEKSRKSINAYKISQNMDIAKVPSKAFNSTNSSSHQRSESQNCETIDLTNQNEVDDKLQKSEHTQNSKKSQELEVKDLEISKSLDLVKIPSSQLNSLNDILDERSRIDCSEIITTNENDAKLRRVTLRKSKCTANSKRSQENGTENIKVPKNSENLDSIKMPLPESVSSNRIIRVSQQFSPIAVNTSQTITNEQISKSISKPLKNVKVMLTTLNFDSLLLKSNLNSESHESSANTVTLQTNSNSSKHLDDSIEASDFINSINKNASNSMMMQQSRLSKNNVSLRRNKYSNNQQNKSSKQSTFLPLIIDEDLQENAEDNVSRSQLYKLQQKQQEQQQLQNHKIQEQQNDVSQNITLVLLPGKWRKSLNLWKKKHSSTNIGQPQDERFSISKQNINNSRTQKTFNSLQLADVSEETESNDNRLLLDQTDDEAFTKLSNSLKNSSYRQNSGDILSTFENSSECIINQTKSKEFERIYENSSNELLPAKAVLSSTTTAENDNKRRLYQQQYSSGTTTSISILPAAAALLSAGRRRRTSLIGSNVISELANALNESINYQLKQKQSQQQQILQNSNVITKKDIILRRCGQSEPIDFALEYSKSALKCCRKIGEGVYGEVFMNKKRATHGGTDELSVLKIIPIEGDIEVNGEQQKKFDEIISEIVIATELSHLRNDKEYMTSGFVEVKKVRCVQGSYPDHLIDLWELYRDNCGTENDHPEIFPEDQLYIVLELANGGQDLEAFTFENALQSYSAFLQTALTLAVAESKFKFEHRDLHWGNILLAPTDEEEIEYRLNGKEYKLQTYGIKVTIIDYTLSRMIFDGCCFYNDLSSDQDLFSATGDYQFDIYRLMKKSLNNDWEHFQPYTNILWLHYVIDKMINGVRYRLTKTKKHRSGIKQLMQLRDELLDYKSASEYVMESLQS